jgi:hypothetical protein
MAQRTILVLYYTRGVFPLRDTIERHLYCWRRYSSHRVAYVNIAMGLPWRFIEGLDPDVVVLHTSLCGMRWSEAVFRRFAPILTPLKTHRSLKIAQPQDEFIHTDLLDKLIEMTGTRLVMSCAGADARAVIYANAPSEVAYEQVLTGYLDPDTVAYAKACHRPITERPHGLTYRAWRAADWLGSLGQLKVRIGEVFAAAAVRTGIKADISLDDEDTVSGKAWIKYLADSRAVIGVEGGASILDRDGSLKQAVEAYRADHPTATFEQVRDAVFPDRDGELPLRALSPRHLEAAATRTAQCLVRGAYNGLLEADVHYIPVEEDFSNLDAVLIALQDDDVLDAVADRAFRDIVEAGRAAYPDFVDEWDRRLECDTPEPPRWTIDRARRLWTLNARDRLFWRFIAWEVRQLASDNPYGRRSRLRERWLRLFADIPA